jgi:hypothetical protein
MSKENYQREGLAIPIVNNGSKAYPLSAGDISDVLDTIPLVDLIAVRGIQVRPFVFPMRPQTPVPFASCVPEKGMVEEGVVSDIVLYDHFRPLEKRLGQKQPVPVRTSEDTSFTLLGHTFDSDGYGTLAKFFLLYHVIGRAAQVFSHMATLQKLPQIIMCIKEDVK